MNWTKIRLPILISILFGMANMSCSKDSETPTPPVPVTPPGPVVEISLLNKSLDSIKYYIAGNWQLHYTRGGMVYYWIKTYENNYLQFLPNDMIFWKGGSAIWSQCQLTYKRDKDMFGDSTYIIQYIDYNSTAKVSLIADKKRNDTLVLIDNHTNPFTYYLTPR